MNDMTNPAIRGESISVTAPSFELVEELSRKAYGFKLFTVLKNRPETGEIQRVYTSNPKDYPVGGRKPMGPTPWGSVVLDGGKAWVGNGAEDVLWAFPDAQLILSLGCESCACAPILKDGKTIGILSLNDGLNHYKLEDLQPLTLLASLLVDAVDNYDNAA